MYMCMILLILYYFPVVTLAAQDATTHPEASQVEAQKQLEEERLDVSVNVQCLSVY